jgi:hypothetical protein
MKALITLLILNVLSVAPAQVAWNKTSDWQLYQIQGHGVFNYSIDTLKSFRSTPLNADSMKSYLNNAQIMKHDGSVAWMGGYVSTCKLEGVTRKIEISNYGGFLYDESTKTFYQVQEEKAGAWSVYLHHSYGKFIK